MFRRKSREPEPGEPDEVDVDLGDGDTGGGLAAGPWDSGDAPDDDVDRIDLGSLRVPPHEGTELQLQVDEQSGQVQSVMLAGPEGALELRAFAAPRNSDLWAEVRPAIAADVSQHGGTATEREGRWGTELVCQMQVQLPDGSQGVQPTRIIGVNGARWLLRATFLGQPALEPETAGAWEDALAAVVVHRGSQAMPSGDALAIVLPPDAQRMG